MGRIKSIVGNYYFENNFSVFLFANVAFWIAYKKKVQASVVCIRQHVIHINFFYEILVNFFTLSLGKQNVASIS